MEKIHERNALVRTDCYAGTDITPQDGDIVEWISTGERWVVCREDDLEGPSALHHWPDGGWCNVRLRITEKDVRKALSANKKLSRLPGAAEGSTPASAGKEQG